MVRGLTTSFLFALTAIAAHAQILSGVLFVQPASGTPSAGTPSFSPGAGTYSSAQTVTITSSPSTVICTRVGAPAATNGITGCAAGSTPYSGPVTVSASETLYAAGGGTGYTDATNSAAYTITPAAPYTKTCFTPGTTTPYTTSAISTTGAVAILFTVAGYGGSFGSITDTLGNGVATALTSQSSSGSADTRLAYYAQPSATGSDQFVLVSGNYATFCVLIVPSSSGLSGLFDSGTDQGSSGSGTSCQPSSAISPGSGNHLLLTATSGAPNSPTTPALTVDSGFTVDTPQLAGSSGVYIAVNTAWLLQNPGASVQPTWSNGASGGTSCAIASFH